jgi:polysaccharide biosynthesis transport protein
MSINVNRESKKDEANLRKIHPEMHLSQPETINSEEGGLDISRMLEAIRRRLWIIFLINIVTVGATIAWNRNRPPMYEGNFKILIEPVTAEGQVVSSLKGNQTSVEEQDLGSAQSLKTTLDYPTQIQLLLSEKILFPVVQKLKPLYPKTSYDTLKKSLIIGRLKGDSETKILEVSYRAPSSNETKQIINTVARAYIQYSLSERQTNVRRAVQFVDSQLPKVQTQVRDLELALQNFREKNQLIDPTTLGTQLGSQTNTIQQDQLTTQVELVKTRQLYRSLEQQLKLQPNGAEAASVLSEAPGYQLLVKQLQEIDVELQIQSAELTDENPKVVLLREKRRKLLPLLEQKASAALGSSLSRVTPNIQSLPYQNALRQDLSKQFITAATQVQILEAKLNGLNVASRTLAGQTGQLPIISRQYENLQRRLKIATEELSKFSQKREELMINAARQEVPWELIASPAVNEVSSSSLLIDLILGSIVGLLLGTGVSLLLEKMNDVIYSLKDLRKELSISILGMIPKREFEQKYLNGSSQNKNGNVRLLNDGGENVTNTRYHFSPFIESFRALNSQIRLLSPDSPIRSLVISSSLPDEGKTTVAIQLAQAAAAMGQRVLLVNADLRKPSLQNLVNPHNNNLIYGLSDVIIGNSKLMDTVQLLPGEENLYILLAGSTASDPTSLLSSKRMKDLMKNCECNFDLVIYDTVPLNFADSLLLIPQTDGLLMVSRLGKVYREVLRNSLRTLQTSNISVLGLVVNMVSDSQSLSGEYYATNTSKNMPFWKKAVKS